MRCATFSLLQSFRPLTGRSRRLLVGSALLAAGCFNSGSACAQTRTQVPEIMPSVAVSAEAEEASNPNKIVWSEAPLTQWIWGADANREYTLRRSFVTNLKHGWLRATCDNRMELFINGERVATSETWEEPRLIDVSSQLRAGNNEITVKVRNDGGIAGFVAQLALSALDPTTNVEWLAIDSEWITTDDQWEATASGSNESLPARTVGRLGDGPWNNVFDNAVASTIRDQFVLLPGYQVERLYTVPRDEQGSWVAITIDPKGRIIASDQENKGLYRITPGAVGTTEPTTVEKLDVNMSAAQGLLFAFDSLYVSVNGGQGSGLYRLRDTDGDDQFDEVKKLKEFRGGGEHGPHALRLSPDRERIVVICGNHTLPPDGFNASQIPSNWGEDLVLPRQWDANGHARGVMAPGGWIASTDPDGENWEILSVGYRNPYDMDFNADGELFAYDADMEWDLGSPWYRPTRVVHATGGSEFGWRSGTGKWPTWYADSLPPVVNIGPGSPVGASFGYGLKFPADYQRAFFICDWTFGTMYAIHLTPEGSTYVGRKEEFLSRTPLPLTDVEVGTDGAMYFTVGGRGTQSELFRVTYVGNESTEFADVLNHSGADSRATRRLMESLQVPGTHPSVIPTIWDCLGYEKDRFIRYAARVALEFQPVDGWIDRLQAETNPVAVIEATIALARQGEPEQREIALAGLARIDLDALTSDQRLAWYRALQLILIRMPSATETDDQGNVHLALSQTEQTLREKLDPRYPSADDRENRELVQLLVKLESTEVVAKGVALLLQPPRGAEEDLSGLIARNRGYGGAIAQLMANPTDKEQIHIAFTLRNARAGWSNELRVSYFEWFGEARSWSGGASYQGFLTNIDREAYDNATDSERLAVEALGARKPFEMPERPAPVGPGQDWTVDSVMQEVGSELNGRNFENGRRAFAAASCVLCHRFAGEGGATGPDLTQAAGRFSVHDLTEAVIEPSKVVSDQYRAMVVETLDGTSVTGRVVSENETSIVVLTDPQDPSKIVEIAKADIAVLEPSPLSLMPADLFDNLNKDEVLDLLAYVLSRGDANAPQFKR